MNKSETSALEAARTLVPLIKASADATERERQIPQPLFETLADAGLFHMLLPHGLGGRGLDLPTYTEVMEELGKADASTAWVINQTGVFGAYAASRLPQHVARRIWAETPRAVVANSPAATIDAHMVPGGFRITGRQGFSTGCRNANWITPHARVIENGAPRMVGGKPDTRMFFMPVEQVEILDTWHVQGMRGTGTHHFAVHDVFVPEEYGFPSLGPALRIEGPLDKFPFTLVFAAGDAAIALGMARACLAAFYDLAATKTAMAIPGLLRDQTMNQISVGQAEGNLRAGRAFLMEAVRDVWKEVKASGTVPLEHRANVFLAANHSIRLAAEVIDAVYNMAGTTGIYAGNLIQRHFQDIHVIIHHVQARVQNYERLGRYWMGLEVGPLVF